MEIYKKDSDKKCIDSVTSVDRDIVIPVMESSESEKHGDITNEVTRKLEKNINGVSKNNAIDPNAPDKHEKPENYRVRSIKNADTSKMTTKRASSAKRPPSSTTSTPRRNNGDRNNGKHSHETPKKESNRLQSNGTPRGESKLQNGKPIGSLTRGHFIKSISLEKESNLISRENSTDSESSSKMKGRPMSSKSLGRNTVTSKISNDEEKKLKRHISRPRIGKTLPKVSIKEKAATIKNSLGKFKSSRVVDKEITSLSIDSETQASVEEDTMPSRESDTNLNEKQSTEHQINSKQINGKPPNSKQSEVPNGKAHWNKLSGVIQKEKLVNKNKSSKKELDDSKSLLLRDGTKSSIATSQLYGDPPVNSTTIRHVVEDRNTSVVNNNDSWIQSAIPYLPLGLSIVCLIMNIIFPGSGTIVSGLSILCCGKTRIQAKDDQVMTALCVNVWVGVSQLFTVTFLLVGWFWSLSWGIKMVALSVEYKRQKKKQRELDLQALALSAFGSQVQVRPFFSKV